MSSNFVGSMVAVATPFKDGELDRSGFQRLVEFQIAGGSDGIVVGGTTGESPNLTLDEIAAMVKLTREICGGGYPVIAGAGGSSTLGAVEKGRCACEAGADGLLVVTPPYSKPPQEGLVLHFETVADEVGLPLIIYNVPGRTSISLTPETVAALARHPKIVALKEASGDMVFCARLIELTGGSMTLLSGDDFTTLLQMCIGGEGGISVTANIVPGKVKEMISSFNNGDLQRARELHFEMLPLHRAMFMKSNPIPVKEALALMGHIGNEIRPPLVTMSDAEREELRGVLTNAGLL